MGILRETWQEVMDADIVTQPMVMNFAAHCREHQTLAIAREDMELGT